MKIIFLFLLSLFSASLAENSNIALKNATKAYEQNDFSQAIDLWKQELEKGLYNDQILYNLGNAYYREGKIGYAIFYYESALKLNPTDQDIAYNLKLAKSQTKDKVESSAEENPILSTLFSIHHFLSLKSQLILLCVLVWLLSLFAFLRIALPSPKAKNITIGFIFGISLIFCILLSSTAYKIYQAETDSRGVVIAANTDVFSGPNEKNSTLHTLSEGTVFQVLSVQGKWAEISIGERIRGFVSLSDVNVIP